MDKKILEIQPLEDTTIIRLLPDRVYQDVVPEFREQIIALLDQGHDRIVFDLSKVEVMNSSGLGILILIQDSLERKKGCMVLSGLSPVLRQLFSQMKLETLFKVTKSENEALELIKTL